MTTCGLLPLIASSILTKSPSALVTTEDLIGAAFVRVGVFVNSSGMVQTSPLLLYARTDTGVRSGVVKAVEATTRVESTANLMLEVKMKGVNEIRRRR